MQRVNTLCSGLFNAAIGIGQTIGPLVSGGLYSALGFRLTEDVIALSCIVFSCLYLAFGTAHEPYCGIGDT